MLPRGRGGGIQDYFCTGAVIQSNALGDGRGGGGDRRRTATETLGILTPYSGVAPPSASSLNPPLLDMPLTLKVYKNLQKESV